MTHATTLAAGLLIATLAILLTPPLAVATLLLTALAYAHKHDITNETPWIHRAALGIALAVIAFNTLSSWTGATVLYQAPFRITLLGRPRFTLEALTFGTIAAAQLATTVLALGTATLKTPPELLHNALHKAGLPPTLATAATLALRLVPDTTRDAHAMQSALQTRGIPTQGLRGKSHLLVPLTARSLDRAMLAEEALLTRGYDPQHAKPRHHNLPPAAWAALATTLTAILIAWLGPGRPPYYPHIEIPWTPQTLLLIILTLPPALILAWRSKPS